MNKIIREILSLLWKTFKLVLWKWLRPMLGRVLFFGLVIVGLVALAIVLVMR